MRIRAFERHFLWTIHYPNITDKCSGFAR